MKRLSFLFFLIATAVAIGFGYYVRTEWLPFQTAQETKSPPLSTSKHYWLVYVQSDGRNSDIWLASPDEPLRDRRKIGSVAHADGYPIKASVSAGAMIAFNKLEAGGQPARDGSLWIIGTDGTAARKVDENVDYRLTPKWSPDGQSFAYLKLAPSGSDKYSSQIYVADLVGNKRLLFSDSESLALMPVGWSANGNELYVHRITESGDAVYKLHVNTQQFTFVARLSDSSSWNLTLSPDKRELSASILLRRNPQTYALVVVDLQTGQVRTVTDGTPNHYTAIWGVDGKSLISNLPGIQEGALRYLNIDGTPQKTAPPQFKIELERPNRLAPVSISPDGELVIVQIYDNSSVNLGVSRPNGSVVLIPPPDLAEFAGWTKAQ